ncbi:MAG: hypothetical protein OEM81_02555 [Acidimicrobiia bacterium]|nr:hypothetical protein [Acidimicrobiia bacterium]MDH3396695.1 hypothetical protein [Acidimicrobiia bacterium]MDH5614939.1 hypothetical protein [Acidimicrobiia bacterium]
MSPTSTRNSMMVENIPISEIATELLAKMDKKLDPETFDAGSARSIEVAAKELLAVRAASTNR